MQYFKCESLTFNRYKVLTFSKKRPIRKPIRISIIGNTMLCCQSIYIFIDKQVYIINNYYILQLFWPNRTLWRYLWPYFLANTSTTVFKAWLLWPSLLFNFTSHQDQPNIRQLSNIFSLISRKELQRRSWDVSLVP